MSDKGRLAFSSPQVICKLLKESGGQWRVLRAASIEKSGRYLESRADEWVWRPGLERDKGLGPLETKR